MFASRREPILCLALLASLAAPGSGSEPSGIELNRCVILADPGEPSYVKFAIEDLRGYLQEITGNTISCQAPVEGPVEPNRPVIVIGRQTAQQILESPLPNEELGPEGYILSTLSRDGREYILAGGEHSRGTRHGVIALMKAIQADGQRAYLKTPLTIVDRPSFAKRGMHFNGWAFKYPYSFRSWREQDWKAYIDILGYHGVNLLYIWPFMEIMPVPLSAEDASYLQEVRRVIDYAQEQHGMEVWIMQSPNRVALDNCGVPDPRQRSYWRVSQADMNPADPAQFAAIVESRRALYQAVDNVDGVCTIDGDPGECPESPLSEYARILRECRTLLDEHNIHGPRTLMINWMWGGWGRLKRLELGMGHTLLPRCFDPEFQAETLGMLKDSLPEPWALIAGRAPYLPICQREGVLDKVTFLPYGTIEGEPAYPATNLDLNRIRSNLGALAGFEGVAGVMGNAQTPLLQVPHIYFYLTAIWNPAYLDQSDRQVLLDVSAFLYPDHQELLADGYAALKETDPDRLEDLVDRLAHLVQEDRLGRPGLFARKLFPDHRIAAELLLMQLRLNCAQARLLRGGADREECARLLEDFFDAYLLWDREHGWHQLEWGWRRWQMGNLTTEPAYPALVNRLAGYLGDEAAAASFFVDLENRLRARHNAEEVRKGCIEPMETAVREAIAKLTPPAPAAVPPARD